MSVIALEISQVYRRFGGLVAIDDVSFSVTEGHVTALIGPNGAGKTTLFNAITNVFAPSSGEVKFFGHSLTNMSAHNIARLGLIRTFQTARVFPGMTVLENVLSGAQLHVHASPAMQMFWSRKARAEERALTGKARDLLELIGLADLADKSAVDLPMGAQKNLEVVRARMSRPRMLLLDAPAAGLNDTETAELSVLLNAIRASGVTIMVVEHNMSLVMGIADQIVVLDAGRVLAKGPPRAIQTDPRVIEAYMG